MHGLCARVRRLSLISYSSLRGNPVPLTDAVPEISEISIRSGCRCIILCWCADPVDGFRAAAETLVDELSHVREEVADREEELVLLLLEGAFEILFDEGILPHAESIRPMTR